MANGKPCGHAPYCVTLAQYEGRINNNNQTQDKDMNTTIAQEGKTKYCSHCKRVLPLEAFSIKTGTKDGKQPYCKECQAAMGRERYAQRKATIVNLKAQLDARRAGETAPAPEPEQAPQALIDVFADKELVAELRRRGYDVTARKVTTIEL